MAGKMGDKNGVRLSASAETREKIAKWRGHHDITRSRKALPEEYSRFQ